MKKLIIALVSVLVSISAIADSSVSMVSSLNLKVTLSPNGAIDGIPSWNLSGPGTLQVAADARSAVLVTAGSGINTITVTASAGGNPLIEKITVTVTAPPPPATSLGVGTLLITK